MSRDFFFTLILGENTSSSFLRIYCLGEVKGRENVGNKSLTPIAELELETEDKIFI